MRKFSIPTIVLSISAAAVIIVLVVFVRPMISMPGSSYDDALPALTSEQEAIKHNLEKNLAWLSEKIGERNHFKPGSLEKAADFIAAQFTEIAPSAELVERQKFKYEGHDFENIALELKGDTKPDEIVVIGAHYDSVAGSPGADDNGSGVVGVIELARLFAHVPHHCTLRFVAFANEEYFFRTQGMGSYQYGERCHSRGEKIKAMISIESIGFFSDTVGSQSYPPGLGLFYPSTANFIAFVGDTKNRELVSRSLGIFRSKADFPSQGTAAPREVPGTDWSDHMWFWKFDYPAFMVTDTAIYRNPNYHRSGDLLKTIDFAKMTRVVTGLAPCIAELAD